MGSNQIFAWKVVDNLNFADSGAVHTSTSDMDGVEDPPAAKLVEARARVQQGGVAPVVRVDAPAPQEKNLF